MDQSVERGGDAVIHCKTEGFPLPRVVWRKEAHGKSYRKLGR